MGVSEFGESGCHLCFDSLGCSGGCLLECPLPHYLPPADVRADTRLMGLSSPLLSSPPHLLCLACVGEEGLIKATVKVGRRLCGCTQGHCECT